SLFLIYFSFSFMLCLPLTPTLFPYTTLFRSFNHSKDVHYLYRIFFERLGLGLRLLIPSKTFAVTRPTERIAVFGTKSIDCDVCTGLLSAVARCFPRARLQPPCPGKGYADVVRKGRF